MKVLHVVPAVATRYGGPSEAALRMVEVLSAAGVDTLLATTDADGPRRLPVETGTVVEHRGVKTVFFPRLPGESLKASPALSCWLRRTVRAFDLVHVHSVFSHPSLAAGAAAREAGVPCIVRPLGQLDGWSLSQHPIRKRLFLAAGGRRLLEGAAALHWTDDSERAAVPPLGCFGRGFVVPLGVDETLFEATASDGREKSVLFLSRLHPKKNVEGLLDAFRDASRAERGWTLVIAGEGEPSYARELRNRAAAEIVDGRVSFVGWLGGEQKVRALRQAALFALPSRQENFGIAVAEAMAAGTPVLVTQAVALSREVVRAGAGWVSGDDAMSLREALAEAMCSEEERRRRGAAGRDLASSHFRWPAVGKALVREYEAILGRAGKRG